MIREFRWYTQNSLSLIIKGTVALCLILSINISVFAQTKLSPQKGKLELEQREADLIKKEAALLKQLSAESLEGDLQEQPQMARMESPQHNSNESNSIAKNISVNEKEGSSIPVTGDANAIISDKNRRIESLSQEVSTLRNRLLLAETEVERLSAIIDERNRKQLTSMNTHKPAPAINQRPLPSAPISASNRLVAPTEQQDMQVVTVQAEKVHLRTGPGEENSPLMTVSRGTRLAVETRSGDWYRVISPAGTRAWVSAQVVAFGDLPISSTKRSLTKKADPYEARAFNLLEDH